MTNTQGVAPALATALEKRGYETLTPVQTKMLDPELQGRDLLVSAQTGSGKTVAFGIAMADTVLGNEDRFPKADKPLALIIAPTRELAMQVMKELEWLYAPASAKVVCCVGGMDARDERRALGKGAHIVVGTPGRLRDHITRGALDLSHIRAAVLDEADEMLNMGFREDLEFILGSAPDKRRTLMFSATVPKSILGLAKTYQNDAVRVNTKAEQSQHVDIEYRALTVGKGERENAIINVLRFYEAKNAIVFCDTRLAVNRMMGRFNNRGFSVVALSGELSQKERTHALQALRDGRAQVCIATDVAARGLDLPDLELVIHADVPKNKEALLHRSGRTGRAGRKGVSVIIIQPKDKRKTERVLQNAKVNAEWAGPPSVKEIAKRDEERLQSDPILTDKPNKEELTFAQELIDQHGPEQVAAAFVRLYRKGKSAPEELSKMPAHKPGKPGKFDREDRAPRPREEFEGSVWYSLTVGRKQTAEPRWLLPMLCKAGGLTKTDIGAIRIQETTSYVEIAPDAVAKFEKALGDDAKLEKSISVLRADGPPPPEGRGGGKKQPFAKKPPFKGKKPYSPDRKSFGDKPGGKPAYKKKPRHNAEERAERLDTRPDTPRRERPVGDESGDKKPYIRKADKPADKKPFKSKSKTPFKGLKKPKSKRQFADGAGGKPTGKRPVQAKAANKKKGGMGYPKRKSSDG